MRVGMHEMHALRVCDFFRDNGGGFRSLQHRFDIVPIFSASAGACPPPYRMKTIIHKRSNKYECFRPFLKLCDLRHPVR